MASTTSIESDWGFTDEPILHTSTMYNASGQSATDEMAQKDEIPSRKAAFSRDEHVTRSQLLRNSVFPDWNDDAKGDDMDDPDEMQKKDPLATQIWKLYSKTKTRLPNQERMENLTWRMMAMSLRRREQMQAR